MAQRHTGVFGKSLVEDLQAEGYSRSEILGNSGFDPAALTTDDPKVPFEALATLFERAASVTGDDLLGFRHAQRVDYRLLGLIAFTGVSSANVGQLLHSLARYQRINSDVLIFDASRLDTDGILEWHYQLPRSVIRQQFIEFNATAMVHVLRRLTGLRLTPTELAFRHFRNRNLAEMARYFGQTPRLGVEENRLQFKLEDLCAPLKTADDILNALLTKYSEQALAALSGDRPSIVCEVEQILSGNPAGSQDTVARDLGVSARTLSRRLAEHDTTFHAVVDGYREAIARNMLRDSDLQVTEIAFLLGYSDLSSFSTAFRRWTKRTPSQFRAEP